MFQRRLHKAASNLASCTNAVQFVNEQVEQNVKIRATSDLILTPARWRQIFQMDSVSDGKLL